MKKVDLSDLLPSLKKLGIFTQDVEKKQALLLVQTSWSDIVGDYMAKNSKPKLLENRILIVVCLHSLIRQELQFQEKKIKQKMDDLLGKDQVEKIQWKIGSIQ